MFGVAKTRGGLYFPSVCHIGHRIYMYMLKTTCVICDNQYDLPCGEARNTFGIVTLVLVIVFTIFHSFKGTRYGKESVAEMCFGMNTSVLHDSTHRRFSSSFDIAILPHFLSHP